MPAVYPPFVASINAGDAQGSASAGSQVHGVLEYDTFVDAPLGKQLGQKVKYFDGGSETESYTYDPTTNYITSHTDGSLNSTTYLYFAGTSNGMIQYVR